MIVIFHLDDACHKIMIFNYVSIGKFTYAICQCVNLFKNLALCKNKGLSSTSISHLSVLDVGEELGRHGLLVLSDGGGELPLLDAVQAPQLLHAHPELARSLDLRQLPEERQVGGGHDDDDNRDVLLRCYSDDDV